MTQTIPKTKRAPNKRRKSWWQKQKQKIESHYEYRAQLQTATLYCDKTPRHTMLVIYRLGLYKTKLIHAQKHIANMKGLCEDMRNRPSAMLFAKLVQDLKTISAAGHVSVNVGFVLNRLYQMVPREKQHAQPRDANGKCVCGAILNDATIVELERWIELHELCESQ